MQTPVPLSFLIRGVRHLALGSHGLSHTSCACASLQPVRHMAVWQSVDDNNLDKALRQLNRKIKDSGLLDELKWRQHHIRPSKMRFYLAQQAYNREMGRRVTEKLYWLRKRKYVEQ